MVSEFFSGVDASVHNSVDSGSCSYIKNKLYVCETCCCCFLLKVSMLAGCRGLCEWTGSNLQFQIIFSLMLKSESTAGLISR